MKKRLQATIKKIDWLSVALTVAGGLYCCFGDHNGLQQAWMLPMIIPAIMGAVAAAGTGIAGAVQAGDASRNTAAQNDADRRMQTKAAKLQIAAQAAQQQKDLAQQQQGALSNLAGQQGQQALEFGQRKIGANTDAMGTIAKTYLRGR